MGEAQLITFYGDNKAYENLIGGNGCAAIDGRWIEVVCPSDGRVFATIPRPGIQDVDLAVQAARHFEFHGSAADKLYDETIPFLDGYTLAIVRYPHGVTGHIIQTVAARNHIGWTLEPVGKSPQIVFADVDLQIIQPLLVTAIIQNGGQTCSAGSRVLVQLRIYDQVAAALRKRFEAIVAGPHDAGIDLCAMVTVKQQQCVINFVKIARDDVIPVLAQGRIAEDAPAMVTGAVLEVDGGHCI